MRKKIIAGNWKMNMTIAGALELVDGLKKELAAGAECDVVVCPPFTALSAVAEAVKGSCIALGCQNMSSEDDGAFTGEISHTMLKEIGVEYVILGHSERRAYYKENDFWINKKVVKVLAEGLTPILCVGETLEEREAEKTMNVVGEQLTAGLVGVSAEDLKKTVIAYEPVWAIGTGKTATPQMAQEVHAFIRKTLVDIAGAEAADAVRIQYGGSMKPGNAPELLAEIDIDGGLIGGAALKADSFAGIISAAK